MYGAECTTMSMLVSSSHPADAGLQVPLVELLLDFGAAIAGVGRMQSAFFVRRPPVDREPPIGLAPLK